MMDHNGNYINAPQDNQQYGVEGVELQNDEEGNSQDEENIDMND
jgi:hypothetical protein